jgi:hypothetical protein
MSLPSPPVNVQVVLADGTVVPVDCIYVGTEPGPMGDVHSWHVVSGPPLDQIVRMTIDALPPFTQVTISEGYEPT